jgi:VCBS repeat protein
MIMNPFSRSRWPGILAGVLSLPLISGRWAAPPCAAAELLGPSPVSITVGLGPIPVAIGDLNADGAADLAVGNVFSNTLSLLLGDGAGGFSRGADLDLGVGFQPMSAVLGDFNADGNQDLAVADSNSDVLRVLIGDGNGAFSRTADVGVGF